MHVSGINEYLVSGESDIYSLSQPLNSGCVSRYGEGAHKSGKKVTGHYCMIWPIQAAKDVPNSHVHVLRAIRETIYSLDTF